MRASACIYVCECRCVSAPEGKTVLWLSATRREMSGSSVPSAGMRQPCSWTSFCPPRAIASSLAELGELLPVSADAGWDVGCGCRRQGRAEPFGVAEPGWGRRVGATEHYPGASRHLCSAPVPVAEGEERFAERSKSSVSSGCLLRQSPWGAERRRRGDKRVV